jgi:hypothetical protein
MEISSLDTRKLYLQRAPYIINIRPLPLTLLLNDVQQLKLFAYEVWAAANSLIVLAHAVV